MKKKFINKTRQGFTLIELMVSVAIIGILVGIAVPSYSSYIQKSRRTSATTALLDLASREAKYYSTHNAYTTSMTELGYASAGPIAIPDDTSNYYSLSVAYYSDTTGFTATATPAGTQATDSCENYTIDYFGVKTPLIKGCW